MSAADRKLVIWSDDDGVWLELGAQTHGPFVTDTEAENRAELIVTGVPCPCEECVELEYGRPTC